MKRWKKLFLGVIFIVLTSCGEQEPLAENSQNKLSSNLEVVVNPVGSGVISPQEEQFEEGTEITLQVEPVDGYKFDQWSGDISGDSPEIKIVMDTNKSVTAHFVRASMLKKFELDEESYYSNHGGNTLMDFDSDGDLDLIFNQFDWPPPQEPRPVLAYRNDGTGIFTKATKEVFAGIPLATTSVGGLVIEDFNGDGRDDLLLAEGGQDHEPFPGGQSLILIANENGQLINETQSRLPQQLAFTHSVTTGDIEGDGDIDIYLGNVWSSSNIGPRFLINDGSGFFSEDTSRIPAEISKLQRKFTSSLLLDVDQDEDFDLVLGIHDNKVGDVILLNDGDGEFSYAPDDSMPPQMGGPGFDTVKIVSADFNKDGWPDLLKSVHFDYQFGANVQLLMNNGDGTFRDETFRIEQNWDVYKGPTGCFGETNGWLTKLFIVDANNDTWPDILVEGDSCLHHLLFLSDEGERFVIAENYSQLAKIDGRPPWALVPGDIDNDGNLDVVLLDYSMTQHIYLRVPLTEEEQEELFSSSPVSTSDSTIATELFFKDDFEEVLQPNWEWVSDGETSWSLSEESGYLQITLGSGRQVDRLLSEVTTLPGDLEIITRVRFNPSRNFQHAGLIVYQDSENFISLVKAFCSLPGIPGLCVGKGIYYDKTWEGAAGGLNFSTEFDFKDESYLKIKRKGKFYTAFYSEDGETWTIIGTHSADFHPIRVGLTVGGSSNAIPADFDKFTINKIRKSTQ